MEVSSSSSRETGGGKQRPWREEKEQLLLRGFPCCTTHWSCAVKERGHVGEELKQEGCRRRAAADTQEPGCSSTVSYAQDPEFDAPKKERREKSQNIIGINTTDI